MRCRVDGRPVLGQLGVGTTVRLLHPPTGSRHAVIALHVRGTPLLRTREPARAAPPGRRPGAQRGEQVPDQPGDRVGRVPHPERQLLGGQAVDRVGDRFTNPVERAHEKIGAGHTGHSRLPVDTPSHRRGGGCRATPTIVSRPWSPGHPGPVRRRPGSLWGGADLALKRRRRAGTAAAGSNTPERHTHTQRSLPAATGRAARAEAGQEQRDLLAALGGGRPSEPMCPPLLAAVVGGVRSDAGEEDLVQRLDHSPQFTGGASGQGPQGRLQEIAPVVVRATRAVVDERWTGRVDTPGMHRSRPCGDGQGNRTRVCSGALELGDQALRRSRDPGHDATWTAVRRTGHAAQARAHAGGRPTRHRPFDRSSWRPACRKSHRPATDLVGRGSQDHGQDVAAARPIRDRIEQLVSRPLTELGVKSPRLHREPTTPGFRAIAARAPVVPARSRRLTDRPRGRSQQTGSRSWFRLRAGLRPSIVDTVAVWRAGVRAATSRPRAVGRPGLATTAGLLARSHFAPPPGGEHGWRIRSDSGTPRSLAPATLRGRHRQCRLHVRPSPPLP